MQYRQLGRSGLRISALTLGTMGFGGRPPFDDVGKLGVEEARRQIDMALDAGVNLIDTADIYSFGLAEEIVGEALGDRRDRVLSRRRRACRWARAPTTPACRATT